MDIQSELVQQSLPPEAVVEQQPDGFWSLLGEIIRDILQRDVPGSVVLLMVFVVMARELFGFYLKTRGKSDHHEH